MRASTGFREISPMKRKRTAQLRHQVASTRRISVSAFFNLRAWICFAVLCAMGISARADVITVTNTNDSGPGSLRQALADVNDGDTITFAVTGTIGLTSGELVVDKNITISGPGPAMLAVSRSSNMPFRIFHVMPDQMVNIEGVTISGGDADIGGGILNDQATLTLTTCSVVNNVASGSGG